MASKYHYYIDPKADRKFAGHLEFLSRVSETAALHLYEEYKDAINFIENNAYSCPLYYSKKLPDITLHNWPFGKRYRIIFEIIGNDVFAYDIQDYRQDPNNNLI